MGHEVLPLGNVVGAFMTILADWTFADRVMPGRVGMNLMTGQAGDVELSINNHLADVVGYVLVSWIHISGVGFGKIDFVVLEQVIAGNEIVGIGQAGGARLPEAQVALRTNRSDYPRVIAAFFRQPNQGGVPAVLDSYIAMANVAIESKSYKRFCVRVDAGSVTSCAPVGKPILVPGKLFEVEPFVDYVFGTQHRLSIEDRKLSIAVLFQKAQA